MPDYNTFRLSRLKGTFLQGSQSSMGYSGARIRDRILGIGRQVGWQIGPGVGSVATQALAGTGERVLTLPT
jgi:hypothetical protein